MANIKYKYMDNIDICYIIMVSKAWHFVQGFKRLVFGSCTDLICHACNEPVYIV